jgi:Cu/Ag efflux pump CusA
VKVFGTDLSEMEKIARQIEAVIRGVPGTSSAYAEIRHQPAHLLEAGLLHPRK